MSVCSHTPECHSPIGYNEHCTAVLSRRSPQTKYVSDCEIAVGGNSLLTTRRPATNAIMDMRFPKYVQNYARLIDKGRSRDAFCSLTNGMVFSKVKRLFEIP